MKACMENYKI